MKIAAAVASVPLLAGALFAQGGVNGRIAGERAQGVTVMLLPPSPQTHEPLRFVLSEKAYVAAFIVYPGAGVRLLYPTVDSPKRLQRGGYNTEQLIGASFDDDVYRAVLGPRLSGPAYLYVIASRHPLDVARYVHRPTTLALAIGQQQSRSFYSDVAFDALLNNAISLGDNASWDSDMYMLWPDAQSSERFADATMSGGLPGASFRYLTCTDGSARLVPANYPFISCPGQAHVRLSAPVAQPVQQSASAAVLAPVQSTSPGSAAAPTVLPTIVGARVSSADRRAAIQQEAASQRVMYTVANGAAPATGEALATVEPSAAVQLQAIEVPAQRREAVPGRGGIGERGAKGSNGGQYSPDQRSDWRQRQRSGETAGAPRLGPNPRLAPNPELAPNPGMPTVARETAVQNHAENRPQAQPRGDAPRAESPRPAPPQPRADAPMGTQRVAPQREFKNDQRSPADIGKAEASRATPVPML